MNGLLPIMLISLDENLSKLPEENQETIRNIIIMFNQLEGVNLCSLIVEFANFLLYSIEITGEESENPLVATNHMMFLVPRLPILRELVDVNLISDTVSISKAKVPQLLHIIIRKFLFIDKLTINSVPQKIHQFT